MQINKRFVLFKNFMYLILNRFYIFGFIYLFFASPYPTYSEPYAPSCEIALEKIDTARKTLTHFRRTIEMARAHEDKASGESAACIGGTPWEMDKPMVCNKSRWQAPAYTEADLAAIAQYRQKRQAFEDLFKQASQICLFEP